MSSSLSWPIVVGAVRRPRWRVLLNGNALAGCESVEVRQTNHRKASTLSAKLAIDADPSALAVLADAQPPISVELQAAFLADGAAEGSESWRSLFIGDVADVHIDPISGSVDLTARDLAGRLIDGKTRETFVNKTASQIASIIAGRFSLTADVDASDGNAGAFYQLEHDKLVNDSFSKTTSYWDLLCYLAQQIGYDLWVDGRTLHFKKAVDISAQQPIPLVYTGRGQAAFPSVPVTDIQLSRSCTLARGIKVIVKVWSSKSKKAQAITYPTTASADAQEYVFVRPGWSPQRALEFAQAQCADILRHERTITIEMPGELSMSPRSTVALSGTATSFDTRYFVDEISRGFSLDGGFSQRITLKNHPVQSDADV